jgi:hypothetical protein
MRRVFPRLRRFGSRRWMRVSGGACGVTLLWVAGQIVWTRVLRSARCAQWVSSNMGLL